MAPCLSRGGAAECTAGNLGFSTSFGCSLVMFKQVDLPPSLLQVSSTYRCRANCAERNTVILVLLERKIAEIYATKRWPMAHIDGNQGKLNTAAARCSTVKCRVPCFGTVLSIKASLTISPCTTTRWTTLHHQLFCNRNVCSFEIKTGWYARRQGWVSLARPEGRQRWNGIELG